MTSKSTSRAPREVAFISGSFQGERSRAEDVFEKTRAFRPSRQRYFWVPSFLRRSAKRAPAKKTYLEKHERWVLPDTEYLSQKTPALGLLLIPSLVSQTHLYQVRCSESGFYIVTVEDSVLRRCTPMI